MPETPSRLMDFLQAHGFSERLEVLARMDIANSWDENGVMKPWNKYLLHFMNHTDSGALINLVGDYLGQLHLDNTLDVFLSETGTNGFDSRPPVKATTRLVQGMPVKDPLIDTPIDAMLQFYRGNVMDGCPDLLVRLKQRLNIPDYNECVRGAGPDPGSLHKVLHQSMCIKQNRDENEDFRANSLGNRQLPEWLGDSKIEDVSFHHFRNRLQSTGDQLGQSFWEHEMSDSENANDFGSPANYATFSGGVVNNATFDGGAANNATFDGGAANNATFDGGAANNATFDGGPVYHHYDTVEGGVACDPLDKFRTLPGGVLDLMEVAKGEPGFTTVPLSVNRLEDLKEALAIDERVALKVNSLGPNIVVKQLDGPLYDDHVDVSVEVYDEVNWQNCFDELRPASPVWEGRPKWLPGNLSPVTASPTREADDLNVTPRGAGQDSAPNTPPLSERPVSPVRPRARIVKPTLPLGPSHTGAIPKRFTKASKKRAISQPEPSGSPGVSNRDRNTVQENYKATPAVITPTIQASLENALNAKYDANVSQEGAVGGGVCGIVEADVVATYSVPKEGSSEQTVQKVLSGKVCKPPKKIKLVLKTPQGTEEPIDIPVAGQKSKLRRPKARSQDACRLQVPEENVQENVMMDLKFAVEISEEGGQRVVRPSGESKNSCRRKSKPARASKDRRPENGSADRQQTAQQQQQPTVSARDRRLAYAALIASGNRRVQPEPEPEPPQIEVEPEVEEDVYTRGSMRMRIPRPWSVYDDALEPLPERGELLFPGQKRTVRPKPKREATSTGASIRRPTGEQKSQSRRAAPEAAVVQQRANRQACRPGQSPKRSRENAAPIGPELAPRPKIRRENRRPLVAPVVEPVPQPQLKRAAPVPLVDPSRRAEAQRARSLENLRIKERMEAAPKLAPREVSDIRRRGGCTTAQPKLPDDFRLGQRVIPVELQDARATKRIVYEDVRLAMEAAPSVAPRSVSAERRMYGCSTAQAAASNDFRLGQRVIPVELPSIEQRLSREEVRRTMESAPTITPRDVSDQRRKGGCSLAEGKVPSGWRPSARDDRPPELGAPPPRMAEDAVREMMVADPKLPPRECSAPRRVFGCSTAKPFTREPKRWR